MIASPGKGSPWYRLSPQLMSWETRERSHKPSKPRNQCVWDEGEGLRGAEWRVSQPEFTPRPRSTVHGKHLLASP